MDEDLLVVDVDADRGAVVLVPVAAWFVTAVPVRLVARAGTFGNGVHHTSFCRQQGDAYRKGVLMLTTFEPPTDASSSCRRPSVAARVLSTDKTLARPQIGNANCSIWRSQFAACSLLSVEQCLVRAASRTGAIAPVPRISTKSGPFSPGEWLESLPGSARC